MFYARNMVTSTVRRTAVNGRVGIRSKLPRSVAVGSESTASKRSLSALALGATMGTSLALASPTLLEENVHAQHLPWTFNGFFSSYDMASVRRGHEVYQNICATCHSLKGIAFRNLVGTLYTEEQAKQIAAEIEVEDGPDDEGNMFERPGALSDYFPKPYKNDEEAKFINNGALPPDLTLITKARHGGPDYIYSLLMGYKDPPAGVTVREGLHYNPYFPGGKIGMEKQLVDGKMEYSDGTPATAAQMAKDVTAFLQWTAEPEHDERKRSGIKFIVAMSFAAVLAGYWKRVKWSVVKSRKISY